LPIGLQAQVVMLILSNMGPLFGSVMASMAASCPASVISAPTRGRAGDMSKKRKRKRERERLGAGSLAIFANARGILGVPALWFIVLPNRNTEAGPEILMSIKRKWKRKYYLKENQWNGD